MLITLSTDYRTTPVGGGSPVVHGEGHGTDAAHLTNAIRRGGSFGLAVHRAAWCSRQAGYACRVTILRVATLLVLAVALPGCTSDEQRPTVLPPAPSTSPTLAPVQVPVPPEATAETPQGASAFASYYLELVEVAFATADAGAVKDASASGCGGCDALIGSIEGLQRQGRKRIGGDYVIGETLAPAVVKGDVVVDITYERRAGRVVDASGQVLETADPVPVTNAQMRLIRRGGSWIVQGYRVVEA